TTVRAVKSLRSPVEARPNFAHRVYHAAKIRDRRPWFVPASALVAGLLLLVLFAALSGLPNHDIVYAMDRVVDRLSNYHGVLEMRMSNTQGEEWMVRRLEIWSAGDKYATRLDDGTMTVNNGERRWQLRPQEKELVLLALLPDPERLGFDLRDEADRARQYPHEVKGEDMVAGRRAIRIEISPPGGLPYLLWIDAETKLPLQLQTAMQNSIQTLYTFINFEPNTGIDKDLFTYAPPLGYQVIEKDPGQIVATITEAAAISGLEPVLPKEAPVRILAFKDRIVLDYGDTIAVESIATGNFKPAGNSALGKAAGAVVEVIGARLRWRQSGIEISVEGPRRVEIARQVAADLSLPDHSNASAQGQVKVPLDMEMARNDQQQVDAGHSPWQLDPVQVALVFVNLKISPEGISGEPQVPDGEFSISANNGVEAVVKVKTGPIGKVYLQRLVRRDETGIWSVTGYDPR
ncbi:MAG: LolA family protein, partial [Bacillota bacterium]